MDFLGRLPERDRERIVAAAATLRLARGEYLIRRGERGGDIFRVMEGELEVLDSRSQPAVVLDVLGRGAMVGEMAFLDEQVRTADVRAAEQAVVQRWDRGVLLRILDGDAGLAAAFYRALAGMATDRARAVTSTAVAGGLGGRSAEGNAEAALQGAAVAGHLRARLEELESVLRRDPAAARREITSALHTFDRAFTTMMGRMSADDAAAAGEAAGHELRPYVVRARLGELALARAAGHCGDLDTLAHITVGQAGGEGTVGEIVDSWLLTLPTVRGLRERVAMATSLIPEVLPSTPPFRLLAIGAASARIVLDHLPSLGRLGGELVCIDSSRDALTAVDAELHRRPTRVRIRLAQDDLASIALGRARMTFPGQHIVIVDGLVEYLPERAAVGVLRWARQQLAPGGASVLTGLAPAPDEAMVRHLLEWPTIRRSPAAFSDLATASGLAEVRSYEASSAGLVAVGTNR